LHILGQTKKGYYQILYRASRIDMQCISCYTS